MEIEKLKEKLKPLVEDKVKELVSSGKTMALEELTEYININSELLSECQFEQQDTESLLMKIWTESSESQIKADIEKSIVDKQGQAVVKEEKLHWITMPNVAYFTELEIKCEPVIRRNMNNNIYFENKADAERFLKALQKFILKNYPRARVENWYKDLKYENIEKDNTCGIELHLDIRM